jgi:hypothetical protein
MDTLIKGKTKEVAELIDAQKVHTDHLVKQHRAELETLQSE